MDTIAAIATASGAAGIGVVRVSGPQVPAIARRLLGRLPAARQAYLSDFQDFEGRTIDRGIALYFRAPASFTGEDVLELQGHGGEIVLGLVLDAVLTAGARLAEPGEFSQRAFLNGQLDLAQVEAIGDLIMSGSRMAARAAARSLIGVFSARVRDIEKQLLAVRAHLEAWLNFPDEPVDALSLNQLAEAIQRCVTELTALIKAAQDGRRLRDGLHLQLVGPPNSGKSSLMNVLTGEETAIVTELPGTTRDLLKTNISLEGIAITLTDSAGLRETTEDPIEAIGMQRTRDALQAADIVLWLASDAEDAADQAAAVPKWLLQTLSDEQRLLQVRNKIDCSRHEAGYFAPYYYISVQTGQGLPALIQAIVGPPPHADDTVTHTEGDFTARTRHIEALQETLSWLQETQAYCQQEQHFVLLAEHLRLAHEALGRVTGRISSEALLGEIFSQFCIGK